MQAQGINVNRDRDAIEAMKVTQELDVSMPQRCEKLLAIYNREKNSSYFIFAYLFRHNPTLAWENVDLSELERISDILWNLDKEACNFDIISNSVYLRELYGAKNYIELASSSSVFEFNILIQLNSCHSENQNDTTLTFEYLCTSCKEISPFIFHRCPHCHEIDTILCEFTLVPKQFESHYSF